VIGLLGSRGDPSIVSSGHSSPSRALVIDLSARDKPSRALKDTRRAVLFQMSPGLLESN